MASALTRVLCSACPARSISLTISTRSASATSAFVRRFTHRWLRRIKAALAKVEEVAAEPSAGGLGWFDDNAQGWQEKLEEYVAGRGIRV